MKALILAAGEGTRLRPLTNTIPKVLVPIGDEPLLGIHLEQLKKAGVTEILINTHWLPEPVRDFVATRSADDFKISLAHEPTLLGSAGTFFSNQDFFKNDPHILVLYGDNFTDISYDALLAHHQSRKNLATIVCTAVENIEKKGMMIMDAQDRILDFIEKPPKEEIVSNYANSGIYIFNADIFEHLEPLVKDHTKTGVVLDFGKDVFPFMLKNNITMHAYPFDGYLVDIGDHAAYAMVNDRVAKLKKFRKNKKHK